MNRFSDFVSRHGKVLGFNVENPAVAYFIPHITEAKVSHPLQRAARNKTKMSKKYKNYKTAATTMGLLMFGSLCNSCTSLHVMKPSIDT